MTVAAVSESPSSFRDWTFFLWPKGHKAIVTSLQTNNGVVTLIPDATAGFFAEHTTALGKRRGRWLRGPIGPRSCTQDVRLAALLMGHRWWQVSSPRVWLYRLIAGAALGVSVYQVAPILAGLAAVLPSAIPSPLTPKGLMKLAKKKNFLVPMLCNETTTDDLTQRTLERIKAAGES